MVRLGDLYAAIDDDAAYAQLPAMVAQFVGARSCNVQRIDRAGQTTVQQFSYYDRTIMADYAARFSGELDMWTQAGLTSGILNRAVPLDDLVPETLFRASSMWNDLFRFHGDDTGHSLGLVHRFDGATMATSFHRAWSAGAFSPAEAARLDTIGTDLHRIYRARELLRRQAEDRLAWANMLDAHQGTVLMVDATLRLVEASPNGRRLLDAGDGIALRQGHLVFSDRAPAAAIRNAVAETVHCRPVGQAAFLCARPSGAAPWRLLVLPAGDVANRCLLLIAPSEPDAARRVRWLRGCFGFTDAEMGVAEGLLAGRTAEEIGDRRRITAATVRTHIRHILDKTDSRRITALISLLMSLP